MKYYKDVIQGSDEWFQLRCGILTASEMKLIITPTLKIASNDKQRSHLFELLAQRITKYVEPSYVSDDMMRGQEEEVEARILYSEKYAPVEEMGFITNDKWGFTLGYSPDGLIGEDGLLECKSRRQKYQLETILTGYVPEEHILQIQTGLLVSERKWLEYVTYCGGLPMYTIKVYPDEKVQTAILEAAGKFEEQLKYVLDKYETLLKSEARLIPTERKIEKEIYV